MSLYCSPLLDQEVMEDRQDRAVLVGLTSMVALVVVAPVTNTVALVLDLDRSTGNKSKVILQIRAFTSLKINA